MSLGMIWGLFRRDRRWESDASLVGKIAIVTGGNTGIGLETVRGLVTRGAKVIIACRDTEKGKQAAKEVTEDSTKDGSSIIGLIIVKELDLSSFASIRNFAEEVLQEENCIHILINNAGLAGCPEWKTKDGFEMQFGVNHLGHFLLTNLLLDRLVASSPSRIVTVASNSHHLGKIHFEDINLTNNYEPLKAYHQSKLANILFTRELAKRIEGTGVTAYCLHPGVIRTGLAQHVDNSSGRVKRWFINLVSRVFFKNVKDGAQTSLYCAVEPELAHESGYYYSGCRQTRPSSSALDDNAAKRLWELSEKSTGFTSQDKFQDRQVSEVRT